MTKAFKKYIGFSFLALIFLVLGFFYVIKKQNISQEKKLNIIWILVEALRAALPKQYLIKLIRISNNLNNIP
jgi:hypothetical protein